MCYGLLDTIKINKSGKNYFYGYHNIFREFFHQVDLFIKFISLRRIKIFKMYYKNVELLIVF